MRVQIDSQYPLRISVSAEDFGKHFAAMDSAEQTAVLRSIVEEMNAHPVQWDHIAIELEHPDNQELCRKLKWVFHTLFPDVQP